MIVVDRDVSAPGRLGHNRVLDKTWFHAHRVKVRAPAPRSIQRRCRCQAHLPKRNRQPLGVGAAIQRIPLATGAIRKERIRSLETLPWIRILATLKNDSGVPIGAVYPTPSRCFGNCTPDAPLMIGKPLGKGVGRRLVGDVEEIPAFWHPGRRPASATTARHAGPCR